METPNVRAPRIELKTREYHTNLGCKVVAKWLTTDNGTLQEVVVLQGPFGYLAHKERK
jgi:hypothetical protein